MMRSLPTVSFLVLLAATSARAQQHLIPEVEPNNSPAAAVSSANGASMGDTLTGLTSTSDPDVFYLDLNAGQQVHLGAVSGNDLNVDVADENSALAFFGPKTVDHDELERNLWFKAPKRGRYYIGITAPNSTQYRIVVDSAPVPQGPGDPTHNLANPTDYAGMVAGNNVLWVATQNRIERVEANGTVTTFATIPFDQGQLNGAIALDGSGNLLAVTQSIIWRISSLGTRTEFARTSYNSRAVAVGPDGDVWIGTSGAIRRFDAQGGLKQTITAFTSSFGQNCSDITYLAFSPAGELHYSAEPCSGFYKLVNNNTTPQQVMTYSASVLGTAFDRDGYLYLVNGMYFANGENSKVVLFDPRYNKSKDPFATDVWHDRYLTQLVFWRDAAGNTTDRLFAIGGGHIIELNHSGIRAPGWPVGKQSSGGGGGGMVIAVSDIAAALMGGPNLTAEQVQYLDSHGNHNGVLDVGDLRSYLRAQGQLSGSAHP